MKEAYCSYEISKLLKEKGFDEPFFFYYRTDDEIKNIRHVSVVTPLSYYQKYIDDEVVAAPTHQMAMAWLRQKGFEIGIFYLFKAINSDVTVFDGYIPNVTQVIDGVYKDSWDMDVVKDYNNAVEAALKYTLENLI